MNAGSPMSADALPEKARRFWYAAMGILVLAAALRCFDLGKSLWIDETSSIGQATAPNFTAAARAYDHPPLYFLILREAWRFTNSFAALRLMSVGFSLVAIGLTLFSIRPRVAGLLAGFLIALAPHGIFEGQELRQYALLNAWRALLLWAASTAVDGLRGERVT